MRYFVATLIAAQATYCCGVEPCKSFPDPAGGKTPLFAAVSHSQQCGEDCIPKRSIFIQSRRASMLSIDNIMVEHFFWWVAGKKQTADTRLYVRVCVSQWRIQGGLWGPWPPFCLTDKVTPPPAHNTGCNEIIRTSIFSPYPFTVLHS